MSFWKKNKDEDSKLTDSSTEPHVLTQPSVAAPPAPVQRPEAGASPEFAGDTGKPTCTDPITNRFGKIRSALSAGTIIQGKLSFDTPVRIDGKLSGEVFSSKVLIVGASATIDAQVEVAALIVMGKVKGKIRATERIEVQAGGEIEGEIQTPVLLIDEGGKFNGGCLMYAQTGVIGSDRASKAPEAPSLPKAPVEAPLAAATAQAHSSSNGTKEEKPVQAEIGLH